MSSSAYFGFLIWFLSAGLFPAHSETSAPATAPVQVNSPKEKAVSGLHFNIVPNSAKSSVRLEGEFDHRDWTLFWNDKKVDVSAQKKFVVEIPNSNKQGPTAFVAIGPNGEVQRQSIVFLPQGEKLVDEGEKQSPDERYAKLEKEWNARNYESVIAGANRIQSAFPDSEWSAKAEQLAGMSFYATQRYGKAIEAWKQVQKITKDNSLAFRAELNIGLTYLETKRTENAYETIFQIPKERVARQEKKEQRRYYLLAAMILSALGRHEAAAEIYAFNFDYFDEPTQKQFLDGLEECVRNFRNREDIDNLLAKNIEVEAKRRIRSAADRVPKLQRIVLASEQEIQSWNNLKGTYNVDFNAGLAYANLASASGVWTTKAIAAGISTRPGLGKSLFLHADFWAFLLPVFSEGSLTGQMQASAGIGKVWKPWTDNVVSVELGGRYFSITNNSGSSTTQTFPQLKFEWRRWLLDQLYFETGLEYGMLGSGLDASHLNLEIGVYANHTLGFRRIGGSLNLELDGMPGTVYQKLGLVLARFHVQF